MGFVLVWPMSRKPHNPWPQCEAGPCVAPSLLACDFARVGQQINEVIDAGADVLIGIGGTPEGVVSAAAMKAMGGEIQAQLAPQSDAEHEAMTAAGYDLDQVLTQDELIRSDNCFFAATGLTDGALLRGVRFDSKGARTQSLVMRSRSGTVRMIDSTHRVSKLREFAAIDY
jgi:fructose-1,6-bisphosphatase II